MMKIYKFLILFVLAVSCSSSDEEPGEFAAATASNYFRSVSQVTVEVYYEVGAAPFTGATGNGLVYWSILSDNLQAIFSYRSAPPTVNVPTQLAQMTQMDDQARALWSVSDVIALHRNHRSGLPTAQHAKFYVYFLNGYSDAGNSIIGFNVNDTPVIAIFKDVVTSSGIPAVQRFVEQSTIVHEMGHALGFVNNGVPQVTNDQDSANGAHTVNSDCVMYWRNEGIADLSNFLQDFITNETTAMWGPEVLQDAQSFSR